MQEHGQEEAHELVFEWTNTTRYGGGDKAQKGGVGQGHWELWNNVEFVFYCESFSLIVTIQDSCYITN